VPGLSYDGMGTLLDDIEGASPLEVERVNVGVNSDDIVAAVRAGRDR
jgi:hypothetical protein